MGVLQHLRHLRGTPLDPFRRSPERKLATELLAQYEADIAHLLDHARDAASTIALASWPDKVRGYGGVRERHAQAVAKERTLLRDAVQERFAEAA
jgi:indolepyruvate ferredoxin oxidoreductase